MNNDLFSISSSYFVEENEPRPRFEQALREYNAEGEFKIILEEHLADNWSNIFSDISVIEKGLGNASCETSLQNKLIAFLSIDEITTSLHNIHYSRSIIEKKSDIAILELTRKVAKTYLCDVAVYFLHKLGTIHTLGIINFSWIAFLFDDEFYTLERLFNDPFLNVMDESSRASFFESLYRQIIKPLDELAPFNWKDLISAIISSDYKDENQKDSAKILLNSIEFLKLTTKFNASNGKIQDHFYGSRPRELLRFLPYDSQETKEKEWILNADFDLKKITFIYADNLSEEGMKKWFELGDLLISSISDKNDPDSPFKSKQKLALELTSKLTEEKVRKWCQHSINNDFTIILASIVEASAPFPASRIWLQKDLFSIWKTEFQMLLDKPQYIENKLSIIFALPHIDHSEDIFKEYISWCKEKYIKLFDENDFPKSLKPVLVVCSIGRVDNDFLLPHIDQSIAFIRSLLSKEETKENSRLYSLLEKLLSGMDHVAWDKSLRHRLLLMRITKLAFSDKNIFTSEAFKKNNLPWYVPFEQMLRTIPCKIYNEEYDELHLSFSIQFAKFCLERLELRKGVSSKETKYTSEQFKEQSILWRKGYLRALEELGFYLDGDVYKVLTNLSRDTSDSDIGKLAKQVLNSLKNNPNKDRSSIQLKRAIVAAEWWLLYSQRLELGLDVDEKAAIRTRRNLLRNVTD